MSEQTAALLDADGNVINVIVVDDSTDMTAQVKANKQAATFEHVPADEPVGIGYSHDGKSFRNPDGLTKGEVLAVVAEAQAAFEALPDREKAQRLPGFKSPR